MCLARIFFGYRAFGPWRTRRVADTGRSDGRACFDCRRADSGGPLNCSRPLWATFSRSPCYDSAPVPLQVLQRPDWHGTPRELGDLFVLHKDRREARAQLLTHQLGWEVRLLIGAQVELVQSQVCRTQEEVLSTGEQWKAAMMEKAWR
jgi:hypothetical protein